MLFLTLVGGAQATTADDVVKKIKELQDTIKAFDGNDDVPLNAALELSKALDKLNENSPVEERFTELLTKLTSLIEASRANRAILIEALQEERENPVITARKAFDTAYEKITEEYKIHIIGSAFGDVRTYWAEGRLCDSTSAMKKLCERKTECALPALVPAQAGKPFDQEILCGFDPAPLVDQKFKAAMVQFTCVRSGNETWDRVAQYPGIDPVTKNAWRPQDKYQADLGSSLMSIRCPFPFKATVTK